VTTFVEWDCCCLFVERTEKRVRERVREGREEVAAIAVNDIPVLW